jgi:hypothetical protein
MGVLTHGRWLSVRPFSGMTGVVIGSESRAVSRKKLWMLLFTQSQASDVTQSPSNVGLETGVTCPNSTEIGCDYLQGVLNFFHKIKSMKYHDGWWNTSR